jgi:hypothetical protein
MKKIASARLRTTTLVITLGAVAALALAGCVPTPAPSQSARPTPSASSTPRSTPSDTPRPTPTPTPSAATTGIATKIPCATLISAQVIYDFNPNFGLDSGFSPTSGTAAATAVAAGGTACNWLNQTSGDTVTVAVARPGASGLASIRATAAAGAPVAGLGDAAYFSTSGQTGRVDVFRGAYWLVATSVYFGSASDANGLVTAALGALR